MSIDLGKTAEIVLDTNLYIKKMKNQTKRLYADNKKVILIKQKLERMKQLNDKIAENHNFIKTVKFYWTLKTTLKKNNNKRILINTKEWYRKKNELTKNFFTSFENKFEKLYPNKMSDIIICKQPIDCNDFDIQLKKAYNIPCMSTNIEELKLEELNNIPLLHECVKKINIDIKIIESIPMNLTEIYNTYFTDEEKKILDKF